MGANGANLSFPEELGIKDNGWPVGTINSGPTLCGTFSTSSLVTGQVGKKMPVSLEMQPRRQARRHQHPLFKPDISVIAIDVSMGRPDGRRSGGMGTALDDREMSLISQDERMNEPCW
ncbi:hypothetical protein ACCO45_004721 [Purpureocillium lilacinum]|uniref:Uncharacterized protein n=1 Tax=Purpureocillium lilacinum TaxID=33203 RepID=A0ACC4DUP4_PURLI